MVSKYLYFLVSSPFLQAIGLVVSDKLFCTLVTSSTTGSSKEKHAGGRSTMDETQQQKCEIELHKNLLQITGSAQDSVQR